MGRHRLFLPLSDIRKDSETFYARQHESLDFFQTDTNLKHMYNDHINTDMSYEDFC